MVSQTLDLSQSEQNCSFSVSTLQCNTGSNSQNGQQVGTNADLEVRLDWLRLTCHPLNEDWMKQMVEAVLRVFKTSGIWKEGVGCLSGVHWQSSGRSPNGILWFWNAPREDGGDWHLMLQIPGSVLKLVDVRQVWELCRFLVDVFNVKATRVDIALDDYARRITADQLQQAAENRDFARVRDITEWRKYRLNRKEEGWGYYCGSLKSLMYLLIYDKLVQSKGEIDSIRLEGRFEDRYAHALFLEWLSIPPDQFDMVSPQFLAGKVMGMIQFVDRSNYGRTGKKEKNVNRLKLLPWWQEFLSAVGCQLRHSVARVDTTFERMKKWMEKQVMPSMAVARKVMGIMNFRRWFDEQIAEKEAGLKVESRAKIMQWSMGQSDVNRENVGATQVDDDGQKWAWVWQQTSLGNEWRIARLLTKTGYEARIRSSGESAKSVPLSWVHCGKDKPTWSPNRQICV